MDSWCVAGDFNIIRAPIERKGCLFSSSAMRLFSDFIETNELIDPPLLGGWFTWSNNQEEPSLSYFDRFLFSASWEEHFHRVMQVALPRPLSNHIPLVLDSEGVKQIY